MRSPWLLGLALLAIGCGGETEEAGASGEETEEHGDHDHGEGAEGMPELPAVPEGARVMFISPEDGATVRNPLDEDGKVEVHVEMGAENITVQPAGEVVAGTGHHHILIDTAAIPEGEAVPADESHIHFGGGQTETDLHLTPGEHTLRLQFADGMHRSYGPALAASITITVEEGNGTDMAEMDEGEGEDAEGGEAEEAEGEEAAAE